MQFGLFLVAIFGVVWVPFCGFFGAVLHAIFSAVLVLFLVQFGCYFGCCFWCSLGVVWVLF